MPEIFARIALTPQGWLKNVQVSIDADGRIATVDSETRPGPEMTQVDALLPALSNLHSHTFQRGMAGLAERRGPAGRDSFWTWREIMYRFLDLLSPEDIEAIAAFAFMEMQEAGFAAVAEFHYLHHQPGGAPYDDVGELSARIAAAASQTGIGLTLLPVLYRHGGVDGRPLAGGQLRFGNDLPGFEALMARAATILKALPVDVGLGVAPHSLRAANRDDIQAALALRPESPFHMHIAEQEAEIDEMLAVHDARPVAWLLDTFEVDRRWCLIHCTHMLPEETIGLARTGAVAGLCPVTEANLGDGIFDAPRFVEAGGSFGVGSDSNIRISTIEELRQLEYSQRLRDRARVVLAGPGESAGRVLYGKALAGGAQALGRECGTITPGGLADLVAIDTERLPGISDGDGILDGWVFCGNGSAITDLWSAGRHMVRSGRHIHAGEIRARYRETMRLIMDRL
ncbi:formimidoylglutamate deiminase [Mesorhizobium sp. J18]|uniref:formimidoylglutamate deiminase n=1 Tax=Mesorhizobium sp. J18 TaxID=935263 RepID=UPI00119C313E|nr:formimidoylglutamate deiminase [Mesorhizobium sp. J18]TWG91263.1 formimidoylglutamate deiminase [Mesorhizobium sp. J18]